MTDERPSAKRPSAKEIAEIRHTIGLGHYPLAEKLLAELDAVSAERDEWKRKAEQAADNFDELTRKSRSSGLDWVSENEGRD